MEQIKEYFAFISYKREDEKWAKWLQYKLEHYHLPTNIRKGKSNLPQSIRPIFKDTSELAAGVLADEIHIALDNSMYLIVICSPLSAQSKWVNKEVQTFIELERSDKIIPFIIGGKPYSDNPEEECLPPALLNLPDEQELLAININEMGREAAAIKVVAHMFHLKFDTLWQRYERDKKKELRQMMEINNKISRNLFRYVAEKAINLTANGDSYLARLLALATLPKMLKRPSCPYVPEAEYALRNATIHNDAILYGPTDMIEDVCISHNGCFLAVGANDHTTRIYDIRSGALIHCLKSTQGFSGSNERVEFSEDDKFVMVSSYKTIRQWDISSGKLIGEQHVDEEHFPKRHSDNPIIASKSSLKIKFNRKKGKVIVLDGKSDETLNIIDFHHPMSTPPVLSPDESFIAVGLADKTIRIKELLIHKRELKTLTGFKGGVNSLCYSPNGKQVLVTSGSNNSRQILKTYLFSKDNNEDNTIWIWDNQLMHLEHKMVSQPSEIGSQLHGIFYGDYEVVAYALPDVVQFWDFSNEECMLSLDNIYVKGVCTSSDGLHLVLILDSSFNIYSADTGEIEKYWPVDNEFTNNMLCEPTFSPSGSNIATSANKSVYVWDIESGTLLYKFLGHTSEVISISFSPNGKYLASASLDQTVRVWDIKKGSCLYVLDLNASNLCGAVAYSPDSKYLAAGADNQIFVIESSTGIIVDCFIGHKSSVTSITFSPDGRFVLSASHDETIKIWSFPLLQDIIDETYDRFKNRPLTPEEQRKYYLE